MSKRPALQQVYPADRLVDFALHFAMRTIHNASRGILPGTRLADRDDSCMMPESIRNASLGGMASFNERFYWGQYHTDVTVPSEYFNPSVTRPPAHELKLDFTYLHDRSESDYALMGIGEEALRQEILAALDWDGGKENGVG